MRSTSILTWLCVLTIVSGWPFLSASGAQLPVNLVRDVPDSVARVSVDSTFSGYDTSVLNDGRWIAEGQDSPTGYGDPNRLGNGGNTWVSADALGEHWIQIDWPKPVRFNTVHIVWSLPEWMPKAFQLQIQVESKWQPLDSQVAAWEPTTRETRLSFKPVETGALRIVQPAGCGGTRELLAAQEIAVYLSDKDPSSDARAITLNSSQIARLVPAEPERNLTRLQATTPGAVHAWSYSQAGRQHELPALIDDNLAKQLTSTPDTLALGVQWPIAHVTEEATLCFNAVPPAPDQFVIEYFDTERWQPVTSGLTATQDLAAQRIHWKFTPVASTGLRVRCVSPPIPQTLTEFLVPRVWPESAQAWPERIAGRGVLATEVLGRPEDPAFAALASAALPMTPARTFVGTPGDITEMGVLWDGSIVGRETISLAVGAERWRLLELRETLQRELLDGWMPAVTTSAQAGQVLVKQTVFCLPGNASHGPVTWIHVTLQNTANSPVDCPLYLRLHSGHGGTISLVDGIVARQDDVLLACVQSPTPPVAADSQSIQFALRLPAAGDMAIDVVHPQTKGISRTEATARRGLSYDTALHAFRSLGDKALEKVIAFHLPEPRVENMVRAVLAQLLINADGDIMPYGAAPSVYEGSLFGIEESYAMLGLAQWGLQDEAARFLDATYLTPEFLKKVDVYQGYDDRHQQYRNGLQPHYAVAAYRLAGNRTWIEKHLPLMRECAEWTIRERRKTMTADGADRPLHAGLLPQWAYGGDIAEVQCYALYANFCCWRGLVDTAWLLEELGDSATAERYRQEAVAYRQDIDRAIEGSYRADRSPPFLPLRLYAEQPDEQMDYYQLFAGCMLDVEYLEPGGQHAKWINDYLESDNRLFCGLPRFRRDAGPGGIDALYGKGYLLNQLRVGSVREFLLGFYAFLAFNMDHTTFTSRETNVIYASDRHLRTGYYVPDQSDPVPCSSAVALQWVRHMLATELSSRVDAPPDTLLLLGGVPQQWLAPGQKLQFQDLPTVFGPVSLVIESSERSIHLRVSPPTRRPPQTIRIRLGHPGERLVQNIEFDDNAVPRVDPSGAWIELPGNSPACDVVVGFE